MFDRWRVSRRNLLSTMPAMPALLWPDAGLTKSAAADSVDDSIDDSGVRLETRFIDFPDKREEFKAHFRFERDLVDRGTVLTWYHWTAFAIPLGEKPVPVVRYEGIELSYFERIGDLTWRIHAHNLSFPRNILTGAFVSEVRNPVTGEIVSVPVVRLIEDPGVLYSPRGYLPLDSKSGKYLESFNRFRVEGNSIVVDHIRAAPEEWPATFIEASTSWVDRRAFEDPTVTSLLPTLSGAYVFPFPAWLRMGDRTGHMLGSIAGRKLRSVAQLPLEFHDRASREHPDLLAPRWGELERPTRWGA